MGTALGLEGNSSFQGLLSCEVIICTLNPTGPPSITENSFYGCMPLVTEKSDANKKSSAQWWLPQLENNSKFPICEEQPKGGTNSQSSQQALQIP